MERDRSVWRVEVSQMNGRLMLRCNTITVCYKRLVSVEPSIKDESAGSRQRRCDTSGYCRYRGPGSKFSLLELTIGVNLNHCQGIVRP